MRQGLTTEVSPRAFTLKSRATEIKAWLQSRQHWPGPVFVAMFHGFVSPRCPGSVHC